MSNFLNSINRNVALLKLQLDRNIYKIRKKWMWAKTEVQLKFETDNLSLWVRLGLLLMRLQSQ